MCGGVCGSGPLPTWWDCTTPMLPSGPPFLASWGDDVVAIVLDDDTDWSKVGELVAESYQLLAPARLVRQLDAPG